MEHVQDYNTRKANINAAERAMWNDELSIHTVDVAEAEKSVHRQRVIEHELRSKPEDFAQLMLTHRFPFRAAAPLA